MYGSCQELKKYSAIILFILLTCLKYYVCYDLALWHDQRRKFSFLEISVPYLHNRWGKTLSNHFMNTKKKSINNYSNFLGIIVSMFSSILLLFPHLEQFLKIQLLILTDSFLLVLLVKIL